MKTNIRLQKYKKNRLAGMNTYDSAIKAGYSISSASNAHIIFEKHKELTIDLKKNSQAYDDNFKLLLKCQMGSSEHKKLLMIERKLNKRCIQIRNILRCKRGL